VKFRQIIRRFLLAAWFAEVAWPLRIVRGILAFYLVVGLTAVVAWLGFGRNAEEQVVIVAEDLTAIALIFLVPLLVIGLIGVPLHRWIGRKFGGFISAQDRDQSRTNTSGDH
jgi:hypothetical protein